MTTCPWESPQKTLENVPFEIYLICVFTEHCFFSSKLRSIWTVLHKTWSSHHFPKSAIKKPNDRFFYCASEICNTILASLSVHISFSKTHHDFGVSFAFIALSACFLKIPLCKQFIYYYKTFSPFHSLLMFTKHLRFSQFMKTGISTVFKWTDLFMIKYLLQIHT